VEERQQREEQEVGVGVQMAGVGRLSEALKGLEWWKMEDIYTLQQEEMCHRVSESRRAHRETCRRVRFSCNDHSKIRMTLRLTHLVIQQMAILEC
jgi:hypothetical protein